MHGVADCIAMMDLPDICPLLSTEIQGFGSLAACDMKLEKITHVSSNIAGVFGSPPDEMLGASLVSSLPPGLMHELHNIMSLRHFAEERHFAGRHDMPSGAMDVSVSQSTVTDHIVVEFELASDSRQSADDFSSELRHLSRELRVAIDEVKLLRTFTSLLKFATGYDSALVYRFGPNEGEVVAEAGRVSQRRLLGGRLSFLENAPEMKPEISHPILHMTADASQTATPIMARFGAPEGLDLSHCHLRGQSVESSAALLDLGARAAVTIPIVMNSGIWGMALLLNQEPQTPPRYVRQLCEALASVVCDRLEIMGQTSSANSAALASHTTVKSDLDGKSVLIVEDNRLIAADLKLTLLDLGFTTAVVFREEASALAYLDTNEVDLGVLDVHLEGTSTSFEVARKLAEGGTPFLFASGYGATADLPGWLGPRPVVLKPASKGDLSARIDELFDTGPVGPIEKRVM